MVTLREIEQMAREDGIVLIASSYGAIFECLGRSLMQLQQEAKSRYVSGQQKHAFQMDFKICVSQKVLSAYHKLF